MRALFTASALLGLTFLATSAFAQRNESFWRDHLFQGVREDLDQIQKDTPKISADEYRLAATKHDLNELQSKMESKHFDQPELDKTISALERVTADNNLSEHHRNMLRDDLRRLREFREHHDGYR
jgi:hypothetical protein